MCGRRQRPAADRRAPRWRWCVQRPRSARQNGTGPRQRVEPAAEQLDEVRVEAPRDTTRRCDGERRDRCASRRPRAGSRRPSALRGEARRRVSCPRLVMAAARCLAEVLQHALTHDEIEAAACSPKRRDVGLLVFVRATAYSLTSMPHGTSRRGAGRSGQSRQKPGPAPTSSTVRTRTRPPTAQAEDAFGQMSAISCRPCALSGPR